MLRATSEVANDKSLADPLATWNSESPRLISGLLCRPAVEEILEEATTA